MRLHLIRHGQTDWNAIRRIQGQSESHLDQTGKSQASALGERLADVPFRHAYVSTSARTRETAQRLFAGRTIDTSFRADLREMCLGRWETLMWPDIERDEPGEVARYHAFDDAFKVENAESLSSMQRRGLQAIVDIVALEHDSGAQDDDHVAVVSHGFLLRAILARLLGRSLTDFEGSVALPNCSHSVVTTTGSGYRVETIDGLSPSNGLWRAIVGAS